MIKEKDIKYLNKLKSNADKYYSSDCETQNIMDAEDNSEYTFQMQYDLELFHLLGNKLKPSKDCDACDFHNDYICLECEVEQVGNIDLSSEVGYESI